MIEHLNPARVGKADTAETVCALLAGAVDQLAHDGRPATDLWRVFGLRMVLVNADPETDLLASLLPMLDAAAQAETIQAAIQAVRTYCGEVASRPKHGTQNGNSLP